MIQAVIFDRDGVLSNFDMDKARLYFQNLVPISLEEMIKFWIAWSDEKGYPPSPKVAKTLWPDFCEELCRQFAIVGVKREKLLNINYLDFMFIYPETQKIIHALRALQVKIVVLTNFSLAGFEESLAALDLLNLIDVAHTSVSLGIAKPNPKAYLAVTDQLGLNPHECLFLDDEMSNVKGAESIGIHAYLIDRTLSHHDLANHVLCNLNPVPDLVKSIK